MNFKIGDKVKLSANHQHRCGSCMNNGVLDSRIEYFIIDSAESGYYSYTAYDKNNQKVVGCSVCLGDYDFIAFSNKKGKAVKTPKVLPPNFILQYEIDEDPFELFATINEVKARIKELMSKGGHSYKVYEIKKMWTPIVEKKEVITIKGL